MRLVIFAVALLMAIGLLAKVQLGSLSKDAAAQEFVKKKKGGGPKSAYSKKGEFNYGRCRELGGTSWNCGVRLHYWGNKSPNGRVVY
jgi:hypothetical protein